MDKVSIQSLYRFKQNYRDRIEVETVDWRKEMREEGLDPDIIFEDFVEFMVNRLDEKTTTQERKDVWPNSYLGEEIYPAVMADWLDLIVGAFRQIDRELLEQTGEGIGKAKLDLFAKRLGDMKEAVLTGSIAEHHNEVMRYAREVDPAIAQELLDPFAQSPRKRR